MRPESTDCAATDCAVLIVGAGPVGAALALNLVQRAHVSAQRIVLLAPEVPAAPQANEPFDLRVSAFTPASLDLFESLGVLAQLESARIGNIERMRVWSHQLPADSPDALQFEASELGVPVLGAIMENRAVQAALQQRSVTQGIQVLAHRAQDIQFKPERVEVRTDQGTISAELVIGADGADSMVRRAAGIQTTLHDYDQDAMVGVVTASRPQPGTALQRFLPSGPLAFLPLQGAQYSFVWSATRAVAAEWFALPDKEFSVELTRHSDRALGDLQLVGARACFPLKRQQAGSYVAPATALVGDAAHVVHPLAGQGINLGLSDAMALTEALRARPARESLGAARALQTYALRQSGPNAVLGTAIHLLDGVFSRADGMSALASQGMAAIGRSRWLKQQFFKAAAGRAREV